MFGGGENDDVRGGDGNDTLAGEEGTTDDCQGGTAPTSSLSANKPDLKNAGCNTYADIEGSEATTRTKRTKHRRASR